MLGFRVLVLCLFLMNFLALTFWYLRRRGRTRDRFHQFCFSALRSVSFGLTPRKKASIEKKT